MLLLPRRRLAHPPTAAFPPPAAVIFLVLLAGFPGLGLSQDTIRIASYNLLNYPGTDAATTRNAYFRRTLPLLDPDILAVQEMQSQTGVDLFRDSVLNRLREPGAPAYASVPFNDGYDTDNALFFKPEKVRFLSAGYIGTSLRDIARYAVTFPGTTDTLLIFSVHLKAGSTLADQEERLGEAATLRAHLNTLPAGAKFIVVGDCNTGASDEPCLLKLEESEPGYPWGRVKDPLDATGIWSGNPSFRFLHTQSTRTRSFGEGSAGGLDDRFDLILAGTPSLDSSVLPQSYKAFGNDGSHFNDSINRLPNAAVPDSVAGALHYSSDHLPVVCSFVFGKVFLPATVPVRVRAGWNMVSLPVHAADSSRRGAFPSAAGPAFFYDGSGYVPAETLCTGRGYWLKFPGPDTIRVTGLGLGDTDTLLLREGWNLVGMLAHDLAAASVTTVPEGVLCTGTFYNFFENAYYLAPTLQPGKAYWVKACADGRLVLRYYY